MATKSNERPYHFIIYGATGYTGKYCIEYMKKCLAQQNSDYRWAIAGRNESKLLAARKQVADILGKKLDNIPVIIADSGDEASLLRMCRRCHVLINCAGPYSRLGEAVVKACIQAVTHHVDLSGEMRYNDYIRLRYHSPAEQAGVFIVNCCGVAVLWEAGINYMKDFCKPMVLNSVDYSVSGLFKPGLNYGTFDSFIEDVSHTRETIKNRRAVNKEVFTRPMPNFDYPQKARLFPFYSDEAKGWCLSMNTFLGLGAIRAQHYNYIHRKERPTQLNGYLVFPSFLSLTAAFFVTSVVFIFTRFSCGVRLLKKYPKIFSFGFFSTDGPKREDVMQSKFQISFLGKGWKNLNEINHNPNIERQLIASGPNLGYVSASICAISSAITIQEDCQSENFPFRGGVFTPGIVFRNTRIVDRLKRNSISLTLSKQ